MPCDEIRRAISEVIERLPDDRQAFTCIRGIGSPGNKPFHFFVSQPEAAAERAAKFADTEELDVTFLIGIVDEIPEGAKDGISRDTGISASNISGIFGFFVDIDVVHPAHGDTKKHYPETIEKAIECLPLEPTWIINSGHGIHAVFLFEEPYFFDDKKDLDKVQGISRQFHDAVKARAYALGGYDIDSTADLSRGFRIPGTVNFKDLTDTKLVDWIRANGPRWDLSDIQEYLADNKFLGDPKNIYAPGTRGWLTDQAYRDLIVRPDRRYDPDKLKNFFAFDKDFKSIYLHKKKLLDRSDSGYDWALACAAAKADFTLQETIDLLISCRAYHGSLDFKKKGKSYFLRTVWNARAKVAAAPPPDPPPPPPAGGDPPPDADDSKLDPLARRGKALGKISDILGLRTLGIILWNESYYEMSFLGKGDNTLHVPSVDKLTNPKAMFNLLLHKYQHAMPIPSTADWNEYKQRLAYVIEPRNSGDEESTPAMALEAHLLEYLCTGYAPAWNELNEDLKQKFYEEGEWFINGPHFRTWRREGKKEVGIEDNKMWGALMRGLGFKEVSIDRHLKGRGRVQIQRWRIPAKGKFSRENIDILRGFDANPDEGQSNIRSIEKRKQW